MPGLWQYFSATQKKPDERMVAPMAPIPDPKKQLICREEQPGVHDPPVMDPPGSQAARGRFGSRRRDGSDGHAPLWQYFARLLKRGSGTLVQRGSNREHLQSLVAPPPPATSLSAADPKKPLIE